MAVSSWNPLSNNAPPAPEAEASGRAFINGLCIKCGLCLENCPAQAICVAGGNFSVSAACTLCAACWELCPAGVINLKEMCHG